MEPTASTAEPAGEAPPRVRKLGCLRIGLGLLGLALLGLGYWYFSLLHARREFLRHAEALVAEVESERPRVPEEENAAELYDEAFRLYVDPAKCGAGEADRNRLYSIDKALEVAPDILAGFLKTNESFLAALRKAQERPSCQRPPDLRNLRSTYRGYNFETRHAVRFLSISARLKARAGATGEATDLLLMALRLTGDADAQRTLLSRTLRSACENLAVAGIQAVINDGDLLEADISRLLTSLRRCETDRGNLEEHLRVETAFALRAYFGPLVSGEVSTQELLQLPGVLNLIPGNATTPPNDRERLLATCKTVLWQRGGYAVRDARFCETVMRRYAAAASRPYPEALDLAENTHNDALRQKEWWKLLSGDLLDAVPNELASDASILARLRAAQLSLGCRLHRLKFGAYPERLAELSEKFPEHFKTLPADPFTGKDFLYKRTAAGCKVWSVGKNRRDDGGLSRADRDPNKREVYDEVFELRR